MIRSYVAPINLYFANLRQAQVIALVLAIPMAVWFDQRSKRIVHVER